MPRWMVTSKTGSSEPSPRTWASPSRGAPATEVKLPPMNQPPAPSGSTALMLPPPTAGSPASVAPVAGSTASSEPVRRAMRVKRPAR
jgi:hypothetical protein